MNIPKISESEWEVMKLLWDKNPLTSDKIIDELSVKKDWSKQTIKTFITRLNKKGAIYYEKVGKSYNYYPTFTEKECRRCENKSFLKRVYDGSLKILFANFIEQENLTEEDINELENMLKDKKQENFKQEKVNE